MFEYKVFSALPALNPQSSIMSSALATGIVEVGRRAELGNTTRTRAFFDTGSQLNFVTNKVIQEAQVPITGKIKLRLSGINLTSPLQTYGVADMYVSMGESKLVRCVVLDHLPVSIKTPGLQDVAYKLQQKGLVLADPTIKDVVDDVGMLIGAASYFEFVSGNTVKDNVTLLRTLNGYMIIGAIGTRADSLSSVQTCVSFRVGVSNDPLAVDTCSLSDKILEGGSKFWDLENIGISEKETDLDDDLAINEYINSVEYDGRQYWVNLPFKPNRSVLPNNKGSALGQLHNLLRRLREKPEHLTCYDKVIKQLLELDFIEEVDIRNDRDKEVHYLPHHGVAKDSLSTPLRVVFNASSRGKGVVDSLNDNLMKGPACTELLLDSLLKFRILEYGYTADISKAFLRVGLKLADRDFTRFLWKVNPFEDTSRTLVFSLIWSYKLPLFFA